MRLVRSSWRRTVASFDRSKPPSDLPGAGAWSQRRTAHLPGRTDLVRVDVTVTQRGDEPVTDLKMEDFEVTEDDVPQSRRDLEVPAASTGRARPISTSRSRFDRGARAARGGARGRAAVCDLPRRLSHRQAARDYAAAARRAHEVRRAVRPNDLMVVMDPLTTLYDLKYTRSKADLLPRIRMFEGRRGEDFPVKSVIEEAQLSQRNWRSCAPASRSRRSALATQLGGLREGRKSILFVSQGPPVPPGSPNES